MEPLFSKSASVDVEKAFGVKFGRRKNLNTFCPFHEDPSRSKSQSCSVSRDGLFNCSVCRKTGTATQFFEQRMKRAAAPGELDLTSVARSQMMKEKEESEKQVKGFVLTPVLVDRMHAALMRSTADLAYVTVERGLKIGTIQTFKIGADESRITIPVYADDGSLVNVRRYKPHAVDQPKMVSHQAGNGSPQLYPYFFQEELESGNTLIICEGEWDCMLLWQNKFKAVTATSGVTTWDDLWTERLVSLAISMNLTLVFIYDVNDKESPGVEADLGMRTAIEREYALQVASGFVIKTKVVRLPLDKAGADVTDWFVNENRTAKQLRKVIDDTAFFQRPIGPNKDSEASIAEETTELPPVPDTAPIGAFQEVTLHDAAKARYFYRPIKLRCLVAGKRSAPYLLPRHINVEVAQQDGTYDVIDKEFNAWDGTMLSLVDCTSTQQRRVIRNLLGLDPKSDVRIKILESANIEELFIIPAIEHEREQGPYTMRQCFYLGHGLLTNQVYDFEGYTLPHPQTQSATHIFTRATPASTNVDSFTLTDSRYTQLKTALHTGKTVHDTFVDIASNFSRYVTKIYGRTDLHIAVDLAFHSALAFDFDGVRIHKGWIECLILGDTRTGKGYVTEGINKFYGVGEVISGENLTLAGLVGGIQRVGGEYTLTWGKIPINDKRIVIIDEGGALSQTDISRLSRIRSEGVAEITKVLSEKTTARTRLIWNANPRLAAESTQRLLADYNFGIEAVPELIGAAEDIARFDFALIVAQNEVSSEVINKHHDTTGEMKYDASMLRDLVMWVWSRKPDQIRFTEEAVELVLKAAKDLGSKFSPKLSLVQAEDARFKLARLAVSAAGRTFSTTNGIGLTVDKEHVNFAYNFLVSIYSKPCCGYAQLSAIEKERSSLRSEKETREILGRTNECQLDLICGLLEHRQIGIRDMCDYSSLDRYQAQSVISELVRVRALVKEHSYYIKKPAFRTFLEKLRSELSHETNVTMFEDEDEQETKAS